MIRKSCSQQFFPQLIYHIKMINITTDFLFLKVHLQHNYTSGHLDIAD